MSIKVTNAYLMPASREGAQTIDLLQVWRQLSFSACRSWPSAARSSHTLLFDLFKIGSKYGALSPSSSFPAAASPGERDLSRKTFKILRWFSKEDELPSTAGEEIKSFLVTCAVVLTTAWSFFTMEVLNQLQHGSPSKRQFNSARVRQIESP